MIARILVPALSGTLFGAGLALGGMTHPARVRGFLDLFGAWAFYVLIHTLHTPIFLKNPFGFLNILKYKAI